MKYYLLEPKYKKSLYEMEIHGRYNNEQVGVTTCWRTGSFLVRVPESETEIKELLGNAYDEDDVEFYSWLPDEDDDYIELDDYQCEMLSTYDGCSEDYEVRIEDEQVADMIMEALNENGASVLWDGEHALFEGFDADSCYYEIHGGCVLTECDENGNPLEEQE